MYKSNHELFKDLTDKEEAEFREYGQKTDPPADAFDENGLLRLDKWCLYHPVVRQEWIKRGVVPSAKMPTLSKIDEYCLDHFGVVPE